MPIIEDWGDSAPAMVGEAHTPSIQELTEAMSDLMRRWLEPEEASESIAEGKHLA